MTARQLQWVSIALLGCVRLGDVSSDYAHIVGREAVNLIWNEWRFTLPGPGMIGPLAPPSFRDEPLNPSPSGCDGQQAQE